tara:strand:+ start:1471 stop:1695 length:225 start_codon:yes stop_codon:yes gene_type:complete
LVGSPEWYYYINGNKNMVETSRLGVQIGVWDLEVEPVLKTKNKYKNGIIILYFRYPIGRDSIRSTFTKKKSNAL